MKKQLFPTGFDVCRQIAATECVDQFSGGVSSVVNVDFATTTIAAFWELEIEELQLDMLKTNTKCILRSNKLSSAMLFLLTCRMNVTFKRK